MSLPPGTELQGRYRVEEVLGEGAMGTVYRVADRRIPGRVWAVKEMRGPEPGDPGFAACLAGFRAEAALLASLHHPLLPRVVDFFEEAGRQYLVMDLVPGRDLRRVLEEDGPPPPALAVEWALAVLEVLEFLHSRTPPVVVRDLKPSNLILTPQGQVVLVDFGIARTLLPDSRTATLASGVGSPGYAPPEQYGRGGTDPRSDLYSLGATLYHLLTGQEPTESVRVAVGLAELPPPSRLRPLPPGLDEVVARAMASRVEDRYPGAGAMRADLEQVRSQDRDEPGDGAGATEEAADRRAREADRRPPPADEGERLPGALASALRRRFTALGWTERAAGGFDLALEGTGLLPPLVLVRACGEMSEEEAERDIPAAVREAEALAGRAPRAVYLVLASPRIPNPVAVQQVAQAHSAVRGWRRLLALPLDLGRPRLLDGHVPAEARSDNDLRDPLLNLGAAVGSLRR